MNLTGLIAKYGKLQVTERKDGTTQMDCQERGISRLIHQSGTTITNKNDGSVDTRVVGNDVKVINEDCNLAINGDSLTRVDGDNTERIKGDNTLTIYGDEDKTVWGDNKAKTFSETIFEQCFDYTIKCGPQQMPPTSNPIDAIKAAEIYSANMATKMDSQDGVYGNYNLTTTGNFRASIGWNWYEDIYGPRGRISYIYGVGGLKYTCLTGGMDLIAARSINITTTMGINGVAALSIELDAGMDVTINAGASCTINAGAECSVNAAAVMVNAGVVEVTAGEVIIAAGLIMLG